MDPAREYALRLLGKRPYSRRELTDKLTGRGFPPECASDTVDWLAECGLINDSDYAEMVVRHYSQKGFGAKKLRDELSKRGVPRELWEDALGETPDPGETLDRLIASKLQSDAPDRAEIKKVSDYLARRGFGWADINAAMRRYLDDL